MSRWVKVAILGVVALMVAVVLVEPLLSDDGEDSAVRDVSLPVAAESSGEQPASDATGAADAAADPAADASDSVAVEPTATPVDPFVEVQQRLEADDTDSEAWGDLGALLMAAQDYVRAAEAFAAVLELEPEHAAARADLGKALLFQGMVRVARAELARAAELDPTLVEGQLNLGVTFSHAAPADIPAARAAWQAVLELAPESQFATQAQQYLETYVAEEPAAASDAAASLD